MSPRASQVGVIGRGVLAILALAAPLAAADLAELTRDFQTGEYAKCVEAADEQIDAGTASESVFLLKMQSQLALGRYADASATLDAAQGKFPSSLAVRWIGQRACLLDNDAARARRLREEAVTLYQQARWRYQDPASAVAAARCQIAQGRDPGEVLKTILWPLRKRLPQAADVRVAIAEIALAKHDYQLAAEELDKAAAQDKLNPDIHSLLAKAYAPSQAEKANHALATALARNPRHVESLLVVVEDKIDGERYEEAVELLDKLDQVNPRHPLAWAYRAVLAHLASDREGEEKCRDAALSQGKSNPDVDHLIGRKLSDKYRFAEGVAYQRRALEIEPGFLPAQSQLAQDLLRLGELDEGWQMVERVHERDGYDIVAHNLTKLHDHVAKFRVLEDDGFVVRMGAEEAAVYGVEVLALLKRARERLVAKYDLALDEPTYVEIFPEQQDFAIRTFGLPGGAGFLGVCFGRVVTMNSPASRTASRSSWQSVLWHEFCHVVTLQKTRNKMPRWLSEGISVSEERQADPRWGQSMTPEYREMILGDDLTPVSELSAAFLRPKTPRHLQFAYFESSLVVDYLGQKYGPRAVPGILADLAAGLTIHQALERRAGSLAALDAEFAEHARTLAREFGSDVDWSEPDLPDGAPVGVAAEWLGRHPKSYRMWQRHARQLVAERRWPEAERALRTLIELNPGDASDGSPYTALARVYRQQNKTEQEKEILVEQLRHAADAVDALTRLIEIESEARNWPGVARYCEEAMAIQPLEASMHRRRAMAAEETGDTARAIASLRVLLALGPSDPAETHFRLGRLLHRTGDLREGRLQILRSLEQAPRFRDAQRELLAILSKLQQERERDDEPPRPANQNTPHHTEGDR